MNDLVRRVATCVVAASVLTLGVAGCSSSVRKGDIEKTVKSKLASTLTGHQVGTVTCAGDLEAKVNASTTCSTTIDGTKRTFRAVVTKVEGKKVLYAIKADAASS